MSFLNLAFDLRYIFIIVANAACSSTLFFTLNEVSPSIPMSKIFTPETCLCGVRMVGVMVGTDEYGYPVLVMAPEGRKKSIDMLIKEPGVNPG